jgi:hypothetical protein
MTLTPFAALDYSLQKSAATDKDIKSTIADGFTSATDYLKRNEREGSIGAGVGMLSVPLIADLLMRVFTRNKSGLTASNLVNAMGAGALTGGVSGTMIGEHNKLDKAAAKEDAKTDPQLEEKDRKDAAALRNRHILLALKRALQGAAIGGVAGGMGAADPIGASDGLNASQGALLGLLAGGLAGGGIGAAEGGLKRSVGMDPLLNTIATARRP